jgi:WXG100 family type VII secretion target
MENTELQADPAKLRNVAERIGQCYKALQSQLSNSQSQINSLKGIWTGEAAEVFQSSFSQLYGRCEETLAIVDKLGKAIYDSADNYERNEQSIMQEAENLPKLPTNTMR